MSHELRTPLNAILGFSEMIAHQTMGPVSPRYAGYAQDIHRSGQHLLTLISDILELARAESGRLELAEEDTTLRSEEHTSELQSLMRISYAVFCLKKKKKQKHNRNTTTPLE